TLGHPGGIQDELDLQVRVGVAPFPELPPDFQLHRELLAALPAERRGLGLSGLHLAAGELPQQSACSAGQALLAQGASAALRMWEEGGNDTDAAHGPVGHPWLPNSSSA